MFSLLREEGPWGDNRGDSQGPWGRKTRSGGTGSGGQRPPDFEDLLQKGQARFQSFFSGGGYSSKKLWGGIFVVLIVWFATGIFRVNEGEQGAVLRFGKWVRTASDTGLHYRLPFPVESVIVRKVAEINRIDVGGIGGGYHDEGQAFMLTGDENILDVNMTIFWFIKELDKYLFRSASPERTVSIAADSIVREVIAKTPMELALTKGKSDIVLEIQKRLQDTLDEYEIGIQIQKVDLQKVDAPTPVIDAFREVQSARADEERMVNEATGYRDSILPRTRGEAAQVLEEAVAYKEQIVRNAKGDAGRFNSIYESYTLSPEVTMNRMYLETMEEVFSKTQKVFVDAKTQGVLPYLPLPELKTSRPHEQKEQG